ncbi:hypothetical protein DB43_GQ00080 [Parachlamydia acanthamoebae]|nr:hypothetical protein DB43_GQ00080 [Parachlamydia acanthamoebae]
MRHKGKSMQPIFKLNPLDAEKAYREMTVTLSEELGISDVYAQDVSEKCCFGWIQNTECKGLICLAFPYPKTAHLFWLGVKKEDRQKGIGRALMLYAEAFCLSQGCCSLTVETLSPRENHPASLHTFNFYRAQGFKPLFKSEQGSAFSRVYLQKILSLSIFKWIDLTHVLKDTIPTWDMTCGFQHATISDPQDLFVVQHIEMFAGVGTHMDAPAHCISGGKTVEGFSLESLIRPCVVIDVSDRAHAHYTINSQDIQNFERLHRELRPNDFVVFYTGWDKYWEEPVKYHNQYQFPNISKSAAEYLISKSIAGIGIDTLSPDRSTEGFPVHALILGAGKFIVENIANALQMPPTGGHVMVIPIRTCGTEAPIRLLGVVEG